jgi:WD40 repeat protein
MYRVLVQVWDFVPGSHWTSRMEEGVGRAERTIAVLSEAYLRSVYGRSEWMAVYNADADGFRRLLVPVRVEECTPPTLMGTVVRLDLFGLAEDAARSRLLAGVDAALRGRAKPEDTPAFPGRSTVFERRTSLRPPTTAPAFPGPESRSAVLEKSLSGGGVTRRRVSRSRRAVPLEPSDPQQIGGHVLLARLGVTATGTVFLGRTADERLVAVKVLHRHLAEQEPVRAGFREEIRNARRVVSAHTPQIVASDAEADRPFLVTEFIDGPTLGEDVRAAGPLPRAELLQLAVNVLLPVADMHRSGVVHRDITPSNVILSLTGPRIVDFGISRRLEDATDWSAHTGNTGSGTPHFMAPEQWSGEPAVSATDVFAWGCLVYYAGTGGHPFPGRTPEEVRRAVLDDDPVLDVLDPAGVAGTTGVDASAVTVTTTGALLRDAVGDALRKDPFARPDAAELLDRLGAANVASMVGEPGDRRTVPHPPSTSALSAGDGVTPGDEAGVEPGGARRGARRRTLLTRRRVIGAAVGLGLAGGAAGVAVSLTSGADSGGSARPGGADAAGGAGPTPSAGTAPPDFGTIRDVFVLAAAFTPDGMTLAIQDNALVKLWDVTEPLNPRPLSALDLDPGGGGEAVVISPDGRLLAACSGDGFVIVYRLRGKSARRIFTLRAHKKPIYGLAFSPDGSLLASGSRDTTVRLWRTPEPLPENAEPPPGPLTAEAVAAIPVDESAVVLEGHGHVVPKVAFSPNGRTLASVGEDQRVFLWDVSEPVTRRKPLKVLAPMIRQVQVGSIDVAFSPDGKVLAASLCGSEVVLWDVSDPREAKEVGRLTEHTDGVECVAFAPTDRNRPGRVLATAGRDRTLRLWNCTDPRRPKRIRVFGEPDAGPVLFTAFSPDGKILLSAGEGRLMVLRTRWR